MARLKPVAILIIATFFSLACRSAASDLEPTSVLPTQVAEVIVIEVTETAAPTVEPIQTLISEPALPTPLATAPLTATPTSTATNTPTATPTSTATPTPTATPTLGLDPSADFFTGPTATIRCTDRVPAPDDLLPLITKTYGVSEAYRPVDLVPLGEHFSTDITLGYPTHVRGVLIEPLSGMITEMQRLGMSPQIISAYRSYSTQAIAYQKWVEQFPDRADQLSARPGHSEHQLGTTIDIGSATLDDYIEDEEDKGLQFHTDFGKTPEGIWLRDNAHRFGFTLSYPREAKSITGFNYEPWHFRYVGPDLATFLFETDLTLTEYQLIQTDIEPCQPTDR